MTCKKRSERGFTVVELLAVIAIMMVVTAIATPTFYYWLPRYRLSASARQISADLQLARMKAISQNTTYRLNILAGGSTYQLEKDAGFTLESGPFTLPDGITATLGPTSVFQSRGTASATDTITVTNGDNETRAVCVRTVGRVFIDDTSPYNC